MRVETRLGPRHPCLALLAILSLLVGCAAPPNLQAAHPAAPPPASAAGVSAGSPTLGSGAPSSTALGRIEFPVSGSEECARHFRDGMLALHSFAYDRAHAS